MWVLYIHLHILFDRTIDDLKFERMEEKLMGDIEPELATCPPVLWILHRRC